MAGGRPSKKPKLLRHTISTDSAAAHVHRHQIFALQQDGEFALRTSYLPANPLSISDSVAESPESPNNNLADPWNEVEFDPVQNEPTTTVTEEVIKAKRTRRVRRNVVSIYINERQSYLDELICLEGRGGESQCRCGVLSAQFRCEDCFSVELVCRDCIVQSHYHAPLHRIKQWKDDFFHTVSLMSLGLHVQLGHRPGEECNSHRAAYDNDFVVIDVHGIHEIKLDYCGCAHAPSRYKQLLRARWFPATTIDPRTAATFAVLQLFHLLSFESKVSAYEFYHSLTQRTDNIGTKPICDRYSVFLRIVSEWRHLKALKRSGWGHNPAGIEATQEGELAVLCPACPQPGKNLPEGWENAPQSEQWLYGLFLVIDANFRLKRHLVSTDSKDPGLSHGWGYFVEEGKYKGHINMNSEVLQEKSTCVSHNAVNMADTKSSKGLAATGVSTVDCARHDMKLPNGFSYSFPRYLNMDYLVFSALVAFSQLIIFNFSYDIACQWHKKLWSRMPSLPLALHLDHPSKFHLDAHIKVCQTKFSFNWTPWVGRMDGEAPERGWANINRVAASTKEMGPGARRDTLDDHFGDWNWKKISGFAVEAEKDHRAALQELEGSIEFSELGAASIAEWKNEVKAWETDRTKPNPFDSRVVGASIQSVSWFVSQCHFSEMTQPAVRLALVQQDARELEDGAVISLHAEVTPSVLISTAIDLEHAQRRLRVDADALGLHVTDTQRANIVTRRNALQHRVEAWSSVQVLYMPIVANLHATTLPHPSHLQNTGHDDSGLPSSKPDSGKAEDFPLLFPSDVCDLTVCNPKLLELEWSLRYAQANDALAECRSHIRLRTQLLRFKAQNIRGQEDHLAMSHAKYCCAHKALLALSTHIDHIGWQRRFQPLKKSDLRPMGDFGGQTQGTTIMSWIWLMHGVSADDSAGLQDSLHVEWCKARARHNRWHEEIQLLMEEMRRVLAFLKWYIQWWEECATLRTFVRAEETEGFVAYAKRQGAVCRALLTSFEDRWAGVAGLVESYGSYDKHSACLWTAQSFIL
ncbi:uncharacterized protein F5147DRAFT_741483 [Suillus discolor]|uniref:CxC2-like cysteine cluster KDZ transposase-associated domain-containing protein n=1 Tax=Suillus discolor TaxID=1912936 RepID=A0A9P7FJ74_9AGAM|nr:uncharacterized protein F5147DRAFT_741483 [Suillus discolor]KAG2120428.1 hypothetical protein F5147DRAFT_741483 [Suillus discolor]